MMSFTLDMRVRRPDKRVICGASSASIGLYLQ